MLIKIADVKITICKGTTNQKEFNALKESIKEHGLLNPIVVTKDMTLIDGRTRFDAVKDLGYPEIEANILKY